MRSRTIVTILVLVCGGAEIGCSPSPHGDAPVTADPGSPRSLERFGQWTTTAMQTASLPATRTKTRCRSR